MRIYINDNEKKAIFQWKDAPESLREKLNMNHRFFFVNWKPKFVIPINPLDNEGDINELNEALIYDLVMGTYVYTEFTNQTLELPEEYKPFFEIQSITAPDLSHIKNSEKIKELISKDFDNAKPINEIISQLVYAKAFSKQPEIAKDGRFIPVGKELMTNEEFKEKCFEDSYDDTDQHLPKWAKEP
jgi:hypothetical protein